MTDDQLSAATPVAVDVHAYCREVEAYLCRRNDGHLIRVVGPAFELVKAWAEDGVPMTVVCEAIDRVATRAERRTQRRRPLRIEFCEDDVRAGYDRWRRAVGVTTAEVPAAATPKRGSLHAHVDRVAVELTSSLVGGRLPISLHPGVEAALAAVEGVRGASSTARGGARETLIETLATADAALVAAAEDSLAPSELAALTGQAEAELAAYRGRLAGPAWDAAVAAARARRVRAGAGLPAVRFD